ncbi:MAG TPA: methyltransferase [Kribbellaceae bacterium]|nr:methyltransferase [Kribbellaceae bacterium]
MSNEHPTTEAIMQLTRAYAGSKALVSAVELGLFTTLADGPLTGEVLRAKLGLQPRGTLDWLDALVSLGMLERDGERYANTATTDLYLDEAKPTYAGWMVIGMAADTSHWDSLTDALRTGRPQIDGDQDFLDQYDDPASFTEFMHQMTGLSMGAAQAIAEKFPWSRYHTVIDVGAAEGCVPVQLALRHPQLTGGGFDLAIVRPAFESYVDKHGLTDRLRFYPGDFFTDPLPSADVLVMGHVLHNWGLDQKLELIGKAYRALPDGGALIVYESLIDDDRRTNTFGLLMSVAMLLVTHAGFDYTGAQCRSWMFDLGFRDSYVEPLVGPDSMVVGLK